MTVGKRRLASLLFCAVLVVNGSRLLAMAQEAAGP